MKKSKKKKKQKVWLSLLADVPCPHCGKVFQLTSRPEDGKPCA